MLYDAAITENNRSKEKKQKKARRGLRLFETCKTHRGKVVETKSRRTYSDGLGSCSFGLKFLLLFDQVSKAVGARSCSIAALLLSLPT